MRPSAGRTLQARILEVLDTGGFWTAVEVYDRVGMYCAALNSVQMALYRLMDVGAVTRQPATRGVDGCRWEYRRQLRADSPCDHATGQRAMIAYLLDVLARDCPDALTDALTQRGWSRHARD